MTKFVFALLLLASINACKKHGQFASRSCFYEYNINDRVGCDQFRIVPSGAQNLQNNSQGQPS